MPLPCQVNLSCNLNAHTRISWKTWTCFEKQNTSHQTAPPSKQNDTKKPTKYQKIPDDMTENLSWKRPRELFKSGKRTASVQ